MFGYPGEELEDIYETIEFVRDAQPDIYLTTVAYPLRGTAMYEEIKERIIHSNGWDSHLQRELNIHGRFSYQLYDFAAKKLASEYRKKQLRRLKPQSLKRIYHSLRSVYCDYKIKRLSHVRT